MNELAKKSKKKDALANVGNLISGCSTSGVPVQEEPDLRRWSRSTATQPHHLLAPQVVTTRSKKYPSVRRSPERGIKAKDAWTDPQGLPPDDLWKLVGNGRRTSFAVVAGASQGRRLRQGARGHREGARFDEKEPDSQGVLGVFGEVQRNFRLDRQKHVPRLWRRHVWIRRTVADLLPKPLRGRHPARARQTRARCRWTVSRACTCSSCRRTRRRTNCDKIKAALDALQSRDDGDDRSAPLPISAKNLAAVEKSMGG